MLAAIMSDKILFSMAVLRSAAGKGRKEISSSAANPHQKQVRSCSQNSRGKSFGLKIGGTGEPISPRMRKVWKAKNRDMHTNRETRRRTGIIFRMRRSATIARTITRDKSMPADVKFKETIRILASEFCGNCRRGSSAQGK